MNFFTKYWGEHGKLIAKALACDVLTAISIIGCFIFSKIALVFVILGYCFIAISCWFCLKYARKNREELE